MSWGSSRLYRERVAEVGPLYRPASPGSACEYCGGPGNVMDHVPGVARLWAMSEAERLAAAAHLRRSCGYCNRLLIGCASSALDERRAFVCEARNAAAARAASRSLGRASASGKAGLPSRFGRGLAPGSRVRRLVTVGDFDVRLGGWSNAYVVFRRDGRRAPWVQLCRASSRSGLLCELGATDAPQALHAAVAALPAYPRDATQAARRRSASSAG